MNNFIKWKLCSEDFQYKTLANDKIIPEDMVIGDFFNSPAFMFSKSPQTVWAIDCFKNVRKENLNQQFYEYCIPQPNKDCALSVLWTH